MSSKDTVMETQNVLNEYEKVRLRLKKCGKVD